MRRAVCFAKNFEVPKMEVLTCISWYVGLMAYVRETHLQNRLIRFSTSILGTWNSWWLLVLSTRFDGLLEADERYFELHGDSIMEMVNVSTRWCLIGDEILPRYVGDYNKPLQRFPKKTSSLGGGNSTIFSFSPRSLGLHDLIWWAYFQRGWNHQPDP